MMNRRNMLLASLALLAAPARAASGASPEAAERVQRLATAWRVADPSGPDAGHRVGVMEVDWAQGQIRLQAEVPLASRAHGLLALPDGGFVAVAARPGSWLMRCDPAGAVQGLLRTQTENPQRSFDGHAELSADGAWLYTVETDPRTGAGWLSVRDTRTLQRAAEFGSGGIDPHQVLRADDGALLLANGGIPRDTQGRKRDLDRMAPCLVRLDPGSGELKGRWHLPDPRLSLRHLAWSSGSTPLLGVALQAEHDDPAQREQAPVLAVWDGQALHLPGGQSAAGGYAGDIAAGPGGGFVLSAQKQRLGLWWHPGQPELLTRVAELKEPCGLVAWPDAAGVSISAARGLARWHGRLAPRMLPWPVALAPDNHAVQLVRV